MSAETTAAVTLILMDTMLYAGDYFEKCLAQRSATEGACGSTYDMDSESIRNALFRADWEEVSHPNVLAPTRVFKAHIPGNVGVISLHDIPDAYVTLRDPKHTGYMEACVSRAMAGERSKSEDTYLIAGEDEGRTICFTFHPGEPIRPSSVPSNDRASETCISSAQARDLGLLFAKIEG